MPGISEILNSSVKIDGNPIHFKKAIMDSALFKRWCRAAKVKAHPDKNTGSNELFQDLEWLIALIEGDINPAFRSAELSHIHRYRASTQVGNVTNTITSSITFKFLFPTINEKMICFLKKHYSLNDQQLLIIEKRLKNSVDQFLKVILSQETISQQGRLFNPFVFFTNPETLENEVMALLNSQDPGIKTALNEVIKLNRLISYDSFDEEVIIHANKSVQLIRSYILNTEFKKNLLFIYLQMASEPTQARWFSKRNMAYVIRGSVKTILTAVLLVPYVAASIAFMTLIMLSILLLETPILLIPYFLTVIPCVFLLVVYSDAIQNAYHLFDSKIIEPFSLWIDHSIENFFHMKFYNLSLRNDLYLALEEKEPTPPAPSSHSFFSPASPETRENQPILAALD